MEKQNPFVIEAADVKSMTSNGFKTPIDLLPSLVPTAQALARPPISRYHVGAVGLSSDGRIFLGVNLEFPNLPLHHSVHAEQFLIANAAANTSPERPVRLERFAVSSAPCGHCRQFLQEIRGASEIGILVTSSSADADDENGEFRPLRHYLPHRFGPDDLLHKDVPLILEPHHNRLSLIDDGGSAAAIENGGSSSGLREEALVAANRAHAPYSRCPSGVAVMDSKGRVFAGSYMESAAYNPSLPPLQAALVAYVAGGGGGYDEIEAAVLVEREGAPVKQESTVRLLLEAVSPKCDFKVFHCK
ncbi:hypothetical protein QJS04_geneDACA010494 [Acorus gramineus]|uniref:cytidine deaminase n=1 Tax=Acorus gramineus TaxID=55184 RepID=A0AAV9AK68_ACOGR|nr:hypothetical protein QJS04_geneDACA010494 [Acorus gramineus]